MNKLHISSLVMACSWKDMNVVTLGAGDGTITTWDTRCPAPLPPNKVTAGTASLMPTYSRTPLTHFLLSSYSLLTHFLLTSYSLLTHFLLTSYSLLTHFLLISYSLLTHFLLTSYSLLTHFLLTSYSLLTHFLLTSHSLLTHPTWHVTQRLPTLDSLTTHHYNYKILDSLICYSPSYSLTISGIMTRNLLTIISKVSSVVLHGTGTVRGLL